jgi:hypothetical protein
VVYFTRAGPAQFRPTTRFDNTRSVRTKTNETDYFQAIRSARAASRDERRAGRRFNAYVNAGVSHYVDGGLCDRAAQRGEAVTGHNVSTDVRVERRPDVQRQWQTKRFRYIGDDDEPGPLVRT